MTIFKSLLTSLSISFAPPPKMNYTSNMPCKNQESANVHSVNSNIFFGKVDWCIFNMILNVIFTKKVDNNNINSELIVYSKRGASKLFAR